MDNSGTPALVGSSDGLGAWSVWIEGGGMPGRWMSDWDRGVSVWRGQRIDAEDAAAERNRVHGQRGLRYTVRQSPSDTDSYYGHQSILMAALGAE